MSASPTPPAPPSDGLHGRCLTVRYHPGQPVVIDGQSIDIPTGRITVLIGPNGSGKSTLLKMLARQLAPDSGEVLMDGRDIAMLSRRAFARRLGILFQENAAPHGVTVEELVAHGRYAHQRLFDTFTADDHAAVEAALQRTGIAALRQHWVSRLSAGQRQLAWIAMALAQETQYLFLDEPTTFLDLAHQFEIMDLLRALNRELGKTLVLVIHDLNLAVRYADFIFALRDGRILASGAPAEVLTPAILRQVFNVEARMIRDDATGLCFCLPLGKAGSTTTPTSPHADRSSQVGTPLRGVRVE